MAFAAIFTASALAVSCSKSEVNQHFININILGCGHVDLVIALGKMYFLLGVNCCIIIDISV